MVLIVIITVDRRLMGERDIKYNGVDRDDDNC